METQLKNGRRKKARSECEKEKKAETKLFFSI